jgi:hypothetical protein
MIDDDAVLEERGICLCTGCTGLYRRWRSGRGELLLVCSACAVAFEAPADAPVMPARPGRRTRTGS